MPSERCRGCREVSRNPPSSSRSRRRSSASKVWRRRDRFQADDRRRSEQRRRAELVGYMLAERGQKLDEAVGFVSGRSRSSRATAPTSTASVRRIQTEPVRSSRGAPAEAAAKLPRVSVIQDHLRRLLNKRGLVDEAIAAWKRRSTVMAIPSLAHQRKIKSARQRLDRKSKLTPSILLLTIGLTACGTPRVTLPGGTGAPAPDFAPAYAEARAACDGLRTMQAELGLSGRAAGQRMRGRVLAVSCLERCGSKVWRRSAPVFILVADGTRGTLLLSRDRRVVLDAPPEEILNALVGIRLGPDDLRAMFGGCVRAAGEATTAPRVRRRLARRGSCRGRDRLSAAQ